MKIAVVCDSGSGLSYHSAKEQGIYYLPLQLIDEDKTYLEGFDTDIETVYELIKAGKMLKTSLPPLGLVEDTFKEIKEEGYDHIIAVPLTSGLSSTMQALRLAADDTGIDITCIETYTTSFIQQYISESAKKLVDQGLELEEIVEKLNDCIAHSNTLIIPDDLDHLKRGGRLTPLAAALGGMLKIKPILRLNKDCNGKIDTYAKVRTMSKAIQTAVEGFDNAGIEDDYELAIFHTGAPETAKQLQDLYFNKYPNCINHVGYIGAVIAAHTGVGCVGLQYIKKI